MASSNEVPDGFVDYDVLADVSQHGASVFDFLSQPNMFGPVSLSAHHMHSPNFSSPLGHGRQPLDNPMSSLTLIQSISNTVPDMNMSLHGEAPSPQIPTVSTTSNDISMSPPVNISKVQRNIPQAQSLKIPSPTKNKKAGPSSRLEKKAEKKSSKPTAAGSLLPVQNESFCTTDTMPPRRNLAVSLPIAKPDRRSRSTRSDTTMPSPRDASAEGSYSASVENNATMHSPSAVDELEPGKDVHNSHTRRCRAKVNNKFQELLRILPKPPPKTGVKHKAQILDYTIRVFREIYAKKLHLEAELALSSRAQLNSWVDSIVRPATQLADILNPFMSLLCTKEKWHFAESWVPAEPTAAVRKSDPLLLDAADDVNAHVSPGQSVSASPGYNNCQFKDVKFSQGQTASNGQGPIGSGAATMNGESPSLVPPPPAPQAPLRLGTAVIPSTGNFDDPDLQSKLERFRDRSRSFVCKPRVDPPGRIMCTMRPEWLPSLGDEEAFQRASLAKEASLSVCFGVPFFVRGHVSAVIVFFDVEQRPYDAKFVDLAGSIAGLLGNAFGARSVDGKK